RGPQRSFLLRRPAIVALLRPHSTRQSVQILSRLAPCVVDRSDMLFWRRGALREGVCYRRAQSCENNGWSQPKAFRICRHENDPGLFDPNRYQLDDTGHDIWREIELHESVVCTRW